MSKYDKLYIIGKLSCALLLESAKKFENLQKLNVLSQNPVIKKKCLQKKFVYK